MEKAHHIILYYMFILVFLLLTSSPSFAIILHPEGEPNLAIWTDKPANSVVGRWSTNASFVVISPKWIITTRHQNTCPTTLTINNVTYNCTYNSENWTGGSSANADLRLIRLKNLDGSDPNLAYAPPYQDTNEVGKYFCIGGYGKYRGDTLSSGFLKPKPYGYTWAGTSNNTLRWGDNTIEDEDTTQTASYDSNTLSSDFDETGTDYEAAPALWDSGGGWFIKQNDIWKLAALSAYVQRYETWFDDPNQPGQNPDFFWGIRISSYAEWINSIIVPDCNESVRGDLNSNCMVNFSDFAIIAIQWLSMDCGIENNFCYGADSEPDNDVDIIDLSVLIEHWLFDTSL
ncbi:MAG: hypothetical protein ABFD79_17610 [Phycisphaerales bacterium]